MYKKALAVIVGVGLMASLVAGCGGDKAATKKEDGAKKELKIGFVMKTLSNPFFMSMEKGAKRAEKELGGIKLEVQVGQEETSIEQQIAIVENMIAQKFDAICIAPGGSKEIVPVLKKAQDAGIPIINIDNRIDAEAAKAAGLKPIPYVGASNVDGGYLAGKYLAEQLQGKGKVAIIEGIQGVDNAEGRKNGAKKAFAEYKDIQVVASQSANWKTEEGLNVMTNILQANPDLNGVFCANDMMAFGAIQAIPASKSGKILVAAYDALDQSNVYIKEGKMISTVDQKPDDQGYYGVKFAIDLINKKEVPMEYMVKLENITKSNVK